MNRVSRQYLPANNCISRQNLESIPPLKITQEYTKNKHPRVPDACRVLFFDKNHCHCHRISFSNKDAVGVRMQNVS